LHTIDFTTALGRLLRDGTRRDSFRANASSAADELNVRAEDRAAFIALSPTDLDAQADVLLRKRLEHVKRLTPELCAKLAGYVWPHFRVYARSQWPEDANRDALHFCEHVLLKDAQTVSRAELNRSSFSRAAGGFASILFAICAWDIAGTLGSKFSVAATMAFVRSGCI
jgi:hypothetical protein